METLTINIPDDKSEAVKQYLAGAGVTIQASDDVTSKNIAYKERITKISVWSDEDIKPIEDARKHFDFKPEEW